MEDNYNTFSEHWTSSYKTFQALLTPLFIYPKVTVTHKDFWDPEDGTAKYPKNTEWASTTYTAIR